MSDRVQENDKKDKRESNDGIESNRRWWQKGRKLLVQQESLCIYVEVW